MSDEKRSLKFTKSDRNWLTRLSTFVDEHIKEIRVAVLGLGVIGLTLIGRSIFIATKFRKVSEIPLKFIYGHVSLQGMVTAIKPSTITNKQSCTLLVDHIPILSFKQIWRQNNEDNFLPITLYGVECTDLTMNWLHVNTLQKKIWFKLLAENNHDSVAALVIVQKGLFRKTVVNTELIRLGLAKFNKSLLSSDDKIVSNWNLKLESEQKKAQQKGMGIWKKSKSEKQTFLMKLLNKLRFRHK